MRRFLNILFYILAAVYPILVFTLLVVLKLPARILSLCIMALGFAFFLSATGMGKGRRLRPIASASLFMLAGIACFITNQAVFLKLYSVAISITFLIAFCSTLIFPPSIIFRFATLADKSIINSPKQKAVESYCKKVCIVWCIFFVANGSVAAYTAMFCSYTVWSVYTGLVSYILMGMLFAVEFIIRGFVNRKMENVYTVSTFKADSRPDDYIMCYENVWSDGLYKTWHDFLVDTAKMRSVIAGYNADSFILHCEDYWLFLVTLVALLQSRKAVMLTQNISESFIKEIKTSGIVFFTDQSAVDSIHIPTILDSYPVPSEQEIRTAPGINADETRIFMYTSGSTGKPKAVAQRMTEFEKDNAFIIQKWGEEFKKRRLVTTVSQHHIYGFLFGITLPFALGVPFRRKRVEFPEEFESLKDIGYMIIATPAFLKRTVDVVEKLPVKDCFIFTSGGVLTPEVAKRTDEVFGFWPMEVYGSTETSGIAYRQSKNGLAWTPFDNAKVWKGEDGCLRIISPYIKDPDGFATADLVDMNDDGSFFLRGRIDSIVKIEEKRISMTEVENRILQTGLVADVKVIAMEDRRQYLAAAIELNEDGRKRFDGKKKLEINNFFHDFLMQYFENVVIPKRWRFVDKMPVDVQGKKHKEDIKALFEVKD